MLIISALQPSFMHLVDELNGNHVIHKCLSNFGAEENKEACEVGHQVHFGPGLT